MKLNDEKKLAKQAEIGAKLAYALGCFLLIGITMFIHTVIASTIKYLRTGFYPKPETKPSIIIFLIFLTVSLSMFFWSRRAYRAAGQNRPVFSKKFILFYSVFFILVGISYYK